MCMATAYLKQSSATEVFLEEVADVQLQGNSVQLRPLLGEPKQVRATIREIDFLNSTIVLEALESERKR
jgi:predicted RNA-binding protein